jgi:hypothetical protein
MPRTSIDSGEALPVFAPVAQQCTVAATHQIQPALHQADGTTAQIVSLPASVGNPVLPEQALCDLAIAISLGPSIQRAYCEYEPLPTLER